MRKKIIFFTGIVLLSAVAYGWYLYHKPRAGVSDIQPVVTIGATALYTEFEQNEAAANAKYLDKIIAVKGTVAEVTATDSTMNILLKEDAAAMGGVSCNAGIKNHQNNAPVKQGNEVLIKGRCTGFLMDVTLTDCVLQP